MKSFVHIGSLVLALGAAGLLAGCASHHETVAQPPRPAHDFEVVETSTKRLLGPKDMEILRAKVADYLDQKGLSASGDYYVKVFLGPDQDGVPADWVVVRLTLGMDLRFQLLGSEDDYYAGYRPYAAYDYYPYGYDNFTRLSFHYYDDYYYGSRYYFPPPLWNHYRGHGHGGGKDHDHDHDHESDNNNDNPPGQASTPFKPISPVGSPPRLTRTRWDGDSSGQNNQNQNGQNNQSRENRGPRRGGQASNPPAAQPAQSVQPTVQPAVQPVRQPEQRGNPRSGFATRSEVYRNQPARAERTEPTRTEAPARSSDSTAPSYSPPAPRAESSPRTVSETPPRESGRSTFKPSGRDD